MASRERVTPDAGSAGTGQPLALLTEELRTVAANWRLLMLGLSLEQWQLNEIDCDHRMVRDKLASALSLWLCTKKGASWMDIVYALRGVEEEVLASNIEAKYCQSGPGPFVTSKVNTPGNRRAKVNAVKLTQKIKHEMKAKFSDLVVTISTTLGRRMSMELDETTGEETFQQFRQYVAGVCTNCCNITKKQSIREMFEEITSKCCWDEDGDPYDLLLSIVRRVKDSELTVRVEECQAEHYSQYLVATRVVDHIATLGTNRLVDCMQEYKPDFEKLTCKLDDVNVNDCSLAYLTDLWKAVKRYVRLPDLFSVLADIEEGCLSVTWLVPKYAVPALMRLPESSFELFDKFSISRMAINGVCIYKVATSLLSGSQSMSRDEDKYRSPPSPQVQLPSSQVPPQVPLPSSQVPPQVPLPSSQAPLLSPQAPLPSSEVPLLATNTLLQAEEHQQNDSMSMLISSPRVLTRSEQLPSSPISTQESYDVELVNDTGANECLVCHLIPRNPMQVSCCGKRFCRACITRVLSENNACPHCLARKDTIQVFEDEGQRQAILELKVYCLNKEQGCDWTGELSHLDVHLSSDPTEGSREGCLYFEHTCIQCIHCFEHRPRYHMRSCPLQQYICPHCKNYSATYRDVNRHHLSKCQMFPVSCPFCKEIVVHGSFRLHKTECLMRPLHGSAVSLAATVVTPSHVFVPPPTFIMTDFPERKSSCDQWYSPPFYYHIGGYKMCLSIDVSGWKIYISAFILLMRGEYDDELPWPFRGAITLQLLNQREDVGHIEMTVPFDDRAPDGVTGRVTRGERASEVQGYELVHHSALDYDESWNTEYIKNDSLMFRVTRIAEVISDLQPSVDFDQSQLQPVPPVTIVMGGFISLKVSDNPCFSSPFYSHLKGYKMCLKVFANGRGRGAGTHVSVYVHLMRGEYDDDLLWPFRGDITLRLINHKADERHVERIFFFDDGAPSSVAGRVAESERALKGRGFGQVISHSALHYGQNTGFFTKDSLEFQVMSVNVYFTSLPMYVTPM